MAQKESTCVSAKEHLQLENQPCIVTFITGNVLLDSIPMDGQSHEPFDSHEWPKRELLLTVSMQYQADKKGQIDVDSIPNSPN